MNKMVIKIHKVVNVRKLIVLSILMYGSIVYGQNTVNGKYCSEYPLKEISNCIDFKDDGSFEYIQNGHLGDIYYGFGMYKSQNENLVLEYNNHKTIKKLNYHELYTWQNNKDFIQIKLYIKDFEGSSLKGVNIVNIETKNSVISTDEEYVVLELPKSNSEYEVLVSLLSYDPYKFRIRGSSNYEARIFLRKTGKNDGLPILDQVMILKTKEISRDRIVTLTDDKKEIVWEKHN